MMPTVYHVINRSDASAYRVYRNCRDLCTQLLGRRISNYLVIKSDASGDRVVNLADAGGDVSEIQMMLEQA